MADQVSALQQSGVAAEKLDSNTGLDTRGDIWRRIDEGKLDLLYLSPEGQMLPAMLERLSHLPLALVAIDEAHCVSQWGHHFSPEYRMLGRLAEIYVTLSLGGTTGSSWVSSGAIWRMSRPDR
jgi:ATP-dependent DNA helicase RecQ